MAVIKKKLKKKKKVGAVASEETVGSPKAEKKQSVEEREKHAAPEEKASDPDQEEQAVPKKKAQPKKKVKTAQHNSVAQTVFVGQLPYTAIAEDVQRHFSKGGLQGQVSVRMLTHRDTGKSKGMAFIQCGSDEDVRLALKLHHSKLKGRQINVERTVGGGGGSDTRKEKINDLRTKSDSSRIKDMKRLVNKVVAELEQVPEDCGTDQAQTLGLLREDADDRVLELLETVPEAVALVGLRHFAALPSKGQVWNRPSLLMSMLRKSFKEAEEKNNGNLLEMFAALNDAKQLEMAAGAIVCKFSKKDAVCSVLPAAWQRHQSRGFMPLHPVTSYRAGGDATKGETSSIAIHLSPEGAAALRRTLNNEVSRVPPELVEMFKKGTASFHYGLRAGSLECKFEHMEDLLPKKAPPKTPPKFKYIELFAGIGGFRVGMDALGGHCVFASEIDSHARKTYSLNFNELPAGDISQIEAGDVPSFDLLTAGFPCQPFSIAGDQGGTGDAKGVLFLEVTRMLHKHRPAAFLLENVPQFEQVEKGKVMRIVLEELREAGYSVVHRVLNARAVVPQRRKRIYLVGFHRDRGGEAAAASFRWPEWADASDKDMLEHNDCSSYNTEHGALPTEAAQAWTTVADILEPAADAWKEHELTPVKLAAVGRQCEYWNHDLDFHFVNEKGAGRTLIGSYLKFGRADQLVAPLSGAFSSSTPSAKAKTDKDQSQRPRIFTPRECCRLMGFPDWYKVSGENRIYHELGNAVCPPVVKSIVECILATGVIPVNDQSKLAGSDAVKKKKKKRLSGDDGTLLPKKKKKKRSAST